MKGHEVQAVQAVEAGSSIESAERILVLDTIHGGSILVEELRLLGKEAFGLNPYRTTSPPAHDFDIVISPVHLSPALLEAVLKELRSEPKVISHHDAVREIVQAASLLKGVRAVEITGTTAKTTVCELLCQMLRGKSVLSLTSAGTRFSDGKKVVSLARLSITPASILKALRLASENGLDAEFAVFEVSLGLTGVGSVGVLTSLSEDYAIAGGTSSASNAKKASLRNFKGILVVPSSCDVFAPAAKAVNIVSKDLYLRGDVAFFRLNALKHAEGEAHSSACESIEGRIRIHLSCDCAFYRKCAEFALAAALSLGVPPEELNTSLQAVPARLSVVEWRRRVLVDNSNSGTKLQFLGEALALAKSIAEKQKQENKEKRRHEKVLIVGEEARYVCEGINFDELRKIVEEKHAEFTKIIVVSDNFSGAFPHNVIVSKSLQEALEEAVKSTGEGAIIVSMVKTWR